MVPNFIIEGMTIVFYFSYWDAEQAYLKQSFMKRCRVILSSFRDIRKQQLSDI